jgi:glycerophosphoryl diester phosphodiesterase
MRKFANGLGVTITSPAYPVTREWIKQVHAAGMIVHGWTFRLVCIEEAHAQFHHFFDMGIDGVFADLPDLAVISRDKFNMQ